MTRLPDAHAAAGSEWIPVSEAAKLAGVTPRTLLAAMRRGRVEHRAYGLDVPVVRLSSLTRWTAAAQSTSGRTTTVPPIPTSVACPKPARSCR